MNPLRTDGRTWEYRAVMTGVVAVCGLGFTCSLAPTVEHTTTGVLLALGVLAALVVGVRLAVRRVREYRQDFDDLLIGAAWRAQHMPAHRGCVGAGGLHRRGLGLVHTDLHQRGYRVRTGTITACAVGAPHTRERLFVLAHTVGLGRCPWRHDPGRAGTPAGHQQDRCPARGGRGWPLEPELARVAYGVPAGVDRRRGLGNAVVPAVAEHIGALIHHTEQETR